MFRFQNNLQAFIGTPVFIDCNLLFLWQRVILKILLTIITVFLFCLAQAQTLGGRSVYNFLNLPASAQQTAVGGVNVSYAEGDVGFAFQNPAMLQPVHSGQLSAGFSDFLAGIKAASLSGAMLLPSKDAVVAAQLIVLDYGTLPRTDAAGNESGTFHPADLVLQIAASKSYLNKWHYGLTAKFISSSYDIYHSQALAFDAGIHYYDSAALFSAGVVAKNMGLQLNAYSGESEDLPFDLQAGITKKLAKAPFGFSATAHHLHRFNITYDDENFNNANGFPSTAHTFNRIFNHFVFATHIYLGPHLEATVGYNYLRRTELKMENAENGLNGFSAGVQLKFDKLQVQLARSTYQKNRAYTHFGVHMQLDKLGIGK